MTALLLLFAWIGLIGAPADSSDDAPPLSERAHALLADRFPSEAHRLEVRVLRTSASGNVSASTEIVFPALDQLPRGRTQVRLRTSGPNGRRDAGWAQLYVAHYDSVMITRRTLSGDDEIDPDDVYAAWMETTRFRGEPLRASDYNALRAEHPLFATRRLSDGRTMRQSDVRPPYAATTGSQVEMNYQRRGLVLRLRCKAREPGYIGDVIRIYAPDTDATYRARLTAPGTAEWIETL